jgi:hypothetical protein
VVAAVVVPHCRLKMQVVLVDHLVDLAVAVVLTELHQLVEVQDQIMAMTALHLHGCPGAAVVVVVLVLMDPVVLVVMEYQYQLITFQQIMEHLVQPLVDGLLVVEEEVMEILLLMIRARHLLSLVELVVVVMVNLEFLVAVQLNLKLQVMALPTLEEAAAEEMFMTVATPMLEQVVLVLLSCSTINKNGTLRKNELLT